MLDSTTLPIPMCYGLLTLSFQTKQANSKCVFGTPDSNPDSVIQIQNYWVPYQKKMFGTRDLSED